MSKNAIHSEFQLFEYLNGVLDEKDAQGIEAHLSLCDPCASVARLVRELKGSPLEQDGQSRIFGEHPDIGELASFFYAESRRAETSNVAAHVALCDSCGEAIAQYARAEHAAAKYKPAKETAGEAPAKAWEMIRDWEDSSFAKLKPASEVLGQGLLDRLKDLLNENASDMKRPGSGAKTAERVPVLVITSSGEVRGVELFEREVDATGARVLKHSEGSARFDNKPVHAVFDLGENSFVVSNRIRRDTIRLEQTRPEEQSRREDYIIIDD